MNTKDPERELICQSRSQQLVNYLKLGLVCALIVFAGVAQAKETICLNMVVKNDSQVITRCLDSVMPLIDYWVIVDMGSTDGTQEIIKKHLKRIPGKLYESSWKNFGHNRSEAFDLAKGKADYILFMDAEDILEFAHDVKFPQLTLDLYKVGGEAKPLLAKANLPWKWVGVAHEYLDSGSSPTSGILVDVKNGATSQNPQKSIQNVLLLMEGLKEEPDNSRYAFYLAEDFRDAGEKGKALEWYQKRIGMGGLQEEIFWSKLQLAHVLKEIKMPSSIVVESYKLAHEYRPTRAESIYYLSEAYNQAGRYEEAYQCLKGRTLLSSDQKGSLFNEAWIEEYGLLFQLSVCAYQVGNYGEAIDAYNKLLANANLPERMRKTVELYRSYSLAKIQDQETKDKKVAKKTKKGLLSSFRWGPRSSSGSSSRSS